MANPVLSERTFDNIPAEGAANVMRLDSTIYKTFLLLFLLLLTTSWTWARFQVQGAGAVVPLLLGALVVGLILAFATVFWKTAAPVTAPLYALVEGVIVGGISALAEQRYPGIAPQAVGITLGIFAAMLIIYMTGIIRATRGFMLGLTAATMGVCLVYMASIVMGFFGMSIPMIHEAGPVGIVFSLVVIVIAALNLVADFALIEYGVASQAPRYMEWYAAFGLLVTLIWLYIEVLRLLGKRR